METMLQSSSRMIGHTARYMLARGMGWGVIGGLVSTMVMDIVLMGALSIMGLPAFTCFSIVGETVAHFFLILGVELTEGVSLGVVAHYVIGPVVGAVFGIAVTHIGALQAETLRKSIVLAVLYIELLSQPILAATPILLKMTVSATLQWFGISFVMHLVLGVVLGVITYYGLRLAARAGRKQSRLKLS